MALPEFPNTICNVNGYERDAYTYIPVLIVGAGESGIAMGCRLKEKLGFDQFRIYERQSGVGGTWWINRYPGVACDVPAIFYSFSFCPNYGWSSFHPPGPEIVNYMNEVCAKYGITDKIQCNTDVEECRWLESEGLWEVTLTHLVPGVGDLSTKDRRAKVEKDGEQSVYIKKEIVRARIVCSAVGGLVEPRGPPDVPGFESFEGETFHSARWDYNVDFKDKNVIVLGTGCSAAQFVPRLTKAPFNAKSVTQLMRSPPWVVPRMKPPFGEKAWAEISAKYFQNVPGLGKFVRFLVAAGAEYDFRIFRSGKYAENERSKMEQSLLRHLRRTTPKKYHEMLTPDYGVGCKRRIFDATWFPGLNDTNIELTTQPLARVKARSVIIGPGQAYPKEERADEREIPADIIVRANGFEVERFLHPLKVTGRGGKDMIEVMEERGGPQAYQGTALDGFPNFFIIFGPNTATGHSSVILATENMVNYSLKFISKVLNGEATTVEVKKDAEIAYTQKLQKALKGTVWMNGGCNSWYFRDDGWNSTVYPWTQIHFTWISMFPKWRDWNISYTRKGKSLTILRRSVKIVLFLVAIAGLRRLRSHGLKESVEDIKGLAMNLAVKGMMALQN